MKRILVPLLTGEDSETLVPLVGTLAKGGRHGAVRSRAADSVLVRGGGDASSPRPTRRWSASRRRR